MAEKDTLQITVKKLEFQMKKTFFSKVCKSMRNMAQPEKEVRQKNKILQPKNSFTIKSQ